MSEPSEGEWKEMAQSLIARSKECREELERTNLELTTLHSEHAAALQAKQSLAAKLSAAEIKLAKQETPDADQGPALVLFDLRVSPGCTSWGGEEHREFSRALAGKLRVQPEALFVVPSTNDKLSVQALCQADTEAAIEGLAGRVGGVEVLAVEELSLMGGARAQAAEAHVRALSKAVSGLLADKQQLEARGSQASQAQAELERTQQQLQQLQLSQSRGAGASERAAIMQAKSEQLREDLKTRSQQLSSAKARITELEQHLEQAPSPGTSWLPDQLTMERIASVRARVNLGSQPCPPGPGPTVDLVLQVAEEAASRAELAEFQLSAAGPVHSEEPPPAVSVLRALCGKLFQLAASSLPALKLPAPPAHSRPEAHLQFLEQLAEAVVAEGASLNLELAQKRDQLLADMSAFDAEQATMRQAVEQAVGAVESTKLQLQQASRAKLANAIVALESELSASQQKALGAEERGAEAKLREEAVLAARQALEEDIDQAKQLWGDRLSELSHKESGMAQLAAHYEQREQAWHTERAHLHAQLAQGAQSPGNTGESFGEAQLEQLQSALRIAEGVIEEQHGSYAALKRQVAMLEEEAVQLRLGSEQLQKSDSAMLRKAEALERHSLAEQLSGTRQALRDQQAKALAAEGSAAAAHKLADEAAALRVTEMRRAEQAEERLRQSRVDAAELMKLEASRWEVLHGSPGQDSGDQLVLPELPGEPPEAVCVLVLDLDMEQLGGARAQELLRDSVSRELAAALCVPQEHLRVTGVSSPGGLVDLVIAAGPEGSAVAVREQLHSMIALEDPRLFQNRGLLASSLNLTATLTALSAIVLADKTAEAAQLRQLLELSSGRRVASVARLQLASARAAITLEYDSELSRLRAAVRVLEQEKCEQLSQLAGLKRTAQQLQAENDALLQSAGGLQERVLALDASESAWKGLAKEMDSPQRSGAEQHEQAQLLQSAEKLALRLGQRAKSIQSRMGHALPVKSQEAAGEPSGGLEGSSMHPQELQHTARIGTQALKAWASTAQVPLRAVSPDQHSSSVGSPPTASPTQGSPSNEGPKQGKRVMPRVKKKWSTAAMSGDLSQEELNALKRWNHTKK